MWELLNVIVTFLLQEGGVFGALIVIAMSWITYREWTLLKKKKITEEVKNNKSLVEEESALIRQSQDIQLQAIEKNQAKLDNIEVKIQDISNHIDNFVKLNEDNNEKVKILSEQLQQVNDERVEELKEILGSYNKTMNELALTLQKIKFVLQTKLGED